MDVTLPNGVVISNVPEGTNKWAIAEKAIQKGLARPEDFGQESYSPTDDMSGFGKFRAGWGKAVTDLGRGAGQWVGLVDREDVVSARERDRALMETGAGMAGNIAGAVATTAPAAFIPGANTVAGAGAIGAGIGALQPSAGTGETIQNVALGGGLGSGSVLATRGVASAWNAGKSAIEPLFKGGQSRIAAAMLRAFAGGQDEAARTAKTIETAMSKPMLAGVSPTTAEVANNAGMAQVERTLRNNPEVMTELTRRLQSNKDAVMAALDGIAGSESRRELVRVVRGAATDPLYGVADDTVVAVDKSLERLLARPSMRKAWPRATSLAMEFGEKIDDVGQRVSGRTLHYLKMAMDDLADNPQVNGIGGNEANAIRGTGKSLVSWMERKLPTYGMARRLYADLSKPLNQMDIGRELRNKLQPALADMGASSRMRSATYAQALRDSDRTAARALGRRTARMTDVMSDEQMSTLRLVGEQLGRRANAEELGRAAGSPTAQNMISQNVMRQFLGPLGVPESMVERAAQSTLMQSIMRPVQYMGQLGEPKVLERLAEAALDPKMAKELLELGIDPQRVNLLLQNQQYIAPILVSGANAAAE